MSMQLVITGVTAVKWVQQPAKDERSPYVLRVDCEDGQVHEVVLWRAAPPVVQPLQGEAA